MDPQSNRTAVLYDKGTSASTRRHNVSLVFTLGYGVFGYLVATRCGATTQSKHSQYSRDHDECGWNRQ